MADERSAGAFDKILGAKVRAQRLAIGMSQERLAEILGVTFQQVQKYEKGLNRIAASRLQDIAIAIRVPVTSLLPAAHGHDDAEPRDDQEAKWLQIWRRTPDEQRSLLMDCTDSMARGMEKAR